MPATPNVAFITIEELLEMIENKDPITIIDALSADQYAEGHLPNAIHLPPEDIEKRAADILPDKEKPVVTYCGSYKCHASTDAARKLMDLGYAHVYDYKAGKKGWEAAGMPLAKG